MRELDAIISAFDDCKDHGVHCILATVVHVEGSSYRKAGARMLVDEYGQMTGAISGGCLEGDALRKALHALHQNQNKLVTYDTSDENDSVIGAQLGCNGIIQVLFEPIDPDNTQHPIELLRQVALSKSRNAIVTLFDLNVRAEQQGTCMIFDGNLVVSQRQIPDSLFNRLKRDAAEVLKHQRPHFGTYQIGENNAYSFIEHHCPPVKLVLVGAGNDARILANMAETLGWEVVITDGRPSHANSERFVASCQVIVTRPEKFLDHISVDANTVFVLISHNYNYDLTVLKLLLQFEDLLYIGILGPKKKYQRMLHDLQSEGIEVTAAHRQIIHAPVGLNIGAESPAEIALSVLAEIQSVLTKTNGIPLREKHGAIHDHKHYEFQVIGL